MRKIIIPADVVITDFNGNAVLDEKTKTPVVASFKKFITDTLLVDNKFGVSMANILSAVEIKNKTVSATDCIELDEADWKRLVDVMSEPSAPYIPAIAIQLVTFFKAIKDAV